jgi:hypothetical protein
MTNKRDAEHAAELDKLDRLRDSGQISSNEYEVRRTRFLAQISRKPKSLTIQVLAVLFWIAVALVVLRIIGALVNAYN